MTPTMTHSEPAREAVARRDIASPERSFWETTRPISHYEADDAATRLINSHFKNDAERARVSIPANPERDDDLIIRSYIRQQARLSASPAPAAGGLEAVREAEDIARFDLYTMKAQIKLALRTLRVVEHYLPAIMDYHAPASGLTGRQVVERVENTIHALASPAATACNLVPPPETYGGSADEPWTGRMPAAATSAETQGGDGVLPCDVAVAPATIIRKGCQVSTLMLAIKQREGRDVGEVSDAARAALAPSTSAATRGEPVALNRQAIRDAIAAASRSGAMGWADHEIDEATDDLVDALAHPAPAESAQVKVKPLVWLDNGHGLYSADEGRYVVDATRAAEDSKVLLLLPCAPTERFDRVVDAIAAAQTKQEAAIRASLATDAER